MTVTLDHPVFAEFSEAELRLELLCSLFAQGKISSRVAAKVAGIEWGDFLDALYERKIPYYTLEALEQDVATLRTLKSHNASSQSV